MHERNISMHSTFSRYIPPGLSDWRIPAPKINGIPPSHVDKALYKSVKIGDHKVDIHPPFWRSAFLSQVSVPSRYRKYPKPSLPVDLLTRIPRSGNMPRLVQREETGEAPLGPEDLGKDRWTAGELLQPGEGGGGGGDTDGGGAGSGSGSGSGSGGVAQETPGPDSGRNEMRGNDTESMNQITQMLQHVASQQSNLMNLQGFQGSNLEALNTNLNEARHRMEVLAGHQPDVRDILERLPQQLAERDLQSRDRLNHFMSNITNTVNYFQQRDTQHQLDRINQIQPGRHTDSMMQTDGNTQSDAATNTRSSPRRPMIRGTENYAGLRKQIRHRRRLAIEQHPQRPAATFSEIVDASTNTEPVDSAMTAVTPQLSTSAGMPRLGLGGLFGALPPEQQRIGSGAAGGIGGATLDRPMLPAPEGMAVQEMAVVPYNQERAVVPYNQERAVARVPHAPPVIGKRIRGDTGDDDDHDPEFSGLTKRSGPVTRAQTRRRNLETRGEKALESVTKRSFEAYVTNHKSRLRHLEHQGKLLAFHRQVKAVTTARDQLRERLEVAVAQRDEEWEAAVQDLIKQIEGFKAAQKDYYGSRRK